MSQPKGYAATASLAIGERIVAEAAEMQVDRELFIRTRIGLNHVAEPRRPADGRSSGTSSLATVNKPKRSKRGCTATHDSSTR
jgi:hypothetical protein